MCIAGAQIVGLARKHAAGRLTPGDIRPNRSLRNPWFKSSGGLTNGGSLPSGHSVAGFAIATAIAERYREHRWVPWIAYGAATFASLTGLPDQAHFPSDIFMGAGFGFSISHFVVLRKKVQ